WACVCLETSVPFTSSIWTAAGTQPLSGSDQRLRPVCNCVNVFVTETVLPCSSTAELMVWTTWEWGPRSSTVVVSDAAAAASVQSRPTTNRKEDRTFIGFLWHGFRSDNS